MTIQSIPDIVGANAKAQISATAAKARRLFLTAHGSSNARFGDTNVAAARGVELPADVEVTISASDADVSDTLDLTSAYAYVPTGTTLTVSFGI